MCAWFLLIGMDGWVWMMRRWIRYNFQVLGTNDADGAGRASQAGAMTTTTVNMRGLGDMKVDLNTAQMEEKYTALELLGEYAEMIPEDFAQFAPKVRACVRVCMRAGEVQAR